MVVLILGHPVKLIWKQGLLGEEGNFQKYLKAEYPRPISIVISNGSLMRHIPVFIPIDVLKIIAWNQLLVVQVWVI